MVEVKSWTGRGILDISDMKVSGGYEEIKHTTPMIGMLKDEIQGVRQDKDGNIFIVDTLKGESKKRWLRKFGSC